MSKQATHWGDVHPLDFQPDATEEEKVAGCRLYLEVTNHHRGADSRMAIEMLFAWIDKLEENDE